MPRSEEQNQQIKDERRERILAAALALFAERGLSGTTIAMIATKAKMSQGLLYHYFPSKDAIYTHLLLKAFGGMGEAARILEELPLCPCEKIEKALVELLGMIAKREDFATYFMLTTQAGRTADLPKKAAAIIREQRQAPYDAIARIIRAGQADGSLRSGDPDELAIVFWTMIKGLAMQRAAFGRAYRAPDPALYVSFFLRS